ncbi:MAG: GNAT family N-acetyltransferase [Gelidibacter sp.]
MSKKDILIREIEKRDDVQVARLIRAVLIEMGVPKVGTAYADQSLDMMTETYAKERAAYFVIEDQGEVVGGAGIAPLDNFEGHVCELQKMYFLPKARRKGLGADMMEVCLQRAKSFGFEKCYLETLPYMTDAAKLYAKSGFEYLDGPLGDTGHYSCDVWMIKTL